MESVAGLRKGRTITTQVTMDQVREFARYSLAGIRIVNGALALFAPVFLANRLGFDPKANGAAIYVFRMFGVRTVVVGAELLWPDEKVRMVALRAAPVVHASDVIAAVSAGVMGQLPPGAAVKAALISTVNTTLAILAQPPKEATTPDR
jgi:hypothetical protein